MNDSTSKLFNGFFDFFLWFFGDFMGGVNDWLHGDEMVTPINWMIERLNGALTLVGLNGLGVSPIPYVNATNLIIIVSITLFVGVGVSIFMLLKNIIFNWA